MTSFTRTSTREQGDLMSETQKKLQEKYMEMQMLQMQLKQIQQQIEALQEQIASFNIANLNLDEMKKVQSGKEILVPLLNGIFVKASIKDTDEFLVNVGANVIVKKNLEGTKQFLQEQLNEMQKANVNMIEEMQKIGLKAMLTEKELNKLASDIQG